MPQGVFDTSEVVTSKTGYEGFAVSYALRR